MFSYVGTQGYILPFVGSKSVLYCYFCGNLVISECSVVVTFILGCKKNEKNASYINKKGTSYESTNICLKDSRKVVERLSLSITESSISPNQGTFTYNLGLQISTHHPTEGFYTKLQVIKNNIASHPPNEYRQTDPIQCQTPQSVQDQLHPTLLARHPSTRNACTGYGSRRSRLLIFLTHGQYILHCNIIPTGN